MSITRTLVNLLLFCQSLSYEYCLNCLEFQKVVFKIHDRNYSIKFLDYEMQSPSYNLN